MVERFIHIEEVDGSNPSGSTMNILFFTRLFYPHIGGVEKHVYEISKILIREGHSVIVVTEQYEKNIKLIEKLEGIKIYRIPALNDNWLKKFQIWKWIWNNRFLIEKADIVHCQDVFFWYLPFRFLYFNKSIFTTFHGYESYPLKLKAIFMHKISERLSMGNICVGNFIKKWYGTKSNYVTYGGVNITKSKKLKVENSEGAVFIGRLDEQTGILTYSETVKLIRKKIPNFKFEIIGDGKFRKEIGKVFKVLGFQKNPEKYFTNYRFAFVSRYLSILEAMMAKRLVFAVYDNPLKEDYLRMTPFAKLINIVNSKNELSEKVLYFLKNSEEEKIMVDKAFEWVKTKSWEALTKSYLLLWKKSYDLG